MASIDDLDHRSSNASYGDTNGIKAASGTKSDHIQELDALVVGAGFGGVYQLKTLRDAGHSVKLVDAGSDYGGVWYWNRYPGARVDIATPYYECSDPALWKDWVWKQRFPGGAELRAYFKYVAERWDLKRDTQFDTFVESAAWSDEQAKWIVKTRAGQAFRVKYLLLDTGFAAKRFVPDWMGIDSFKGTCSTPVAAVDTSVVRDFPSPFVLASRRAHPARQKGSHRRHRVIRYPDCPGAKLSRETAHRLPTYPENVLANGPS
jgi:hypothetical protein